MDCPEKTPYFNGKECDVCPEGSVWNPDSRNCETCKGGMIVLDETCQCPAGLYWNRSNCIECNPPKYFNFS